MEKPVILCVDDDLDGLVGREALLRLNGYEVLISTSPHQGLRLLGWCPVDAVLLDYRMPEMCGDLVATRMKQLKPGVPIMLLSADDELEEAVLDQTDMFFSKREAPQKLVEAVQILLAARHRSFSDWLQRWRGKRAA